MPLRFADIAAFTSVPDVARQGGTAAMDYGRLQESKRQYDQSLAFDKKREQRRQQEWDIAQNFQSLDWAAKQAEQRRKAYWVWRDELTAADQSDDPSERRKIIDKGKSLGFTVEDPAPVEPIPQPSDVAPEARPPGPPVQGDAPAKTPPPSMLGRVSEFVDQAFRSLQGQPEAPPGPPAQGQAPQQAPAIDTNRIAQAVEAVKSFLPDGKLSSLSLKIPEQKESSTTGTPAQDIAPLATEQDLTFRDAAGNPVGTLNPASNVMERQALFDRWSDSFSKSYSGEAKVAWDMAADMVRGRNLPPRVAQEETQKQFNINYSQLNANKRGEMAIAAAGRRASMDRPGQDTNEWFRGQTRGEVVADKSGLRFHSEAQRAVDEGLSLIRNAPNGITIQKIAGNLLEAMGEKGVKSNQDWQRAFGDPGMWTQLQNWASKQTDDNVSPTQMRMLEGALQAMAGKNAKSLSAAWKRAMSQYENARRNISPTAAEGFRAPLEAIGQTWGLEVPNDGYGGGYGSPAAPSAPAGDTSGDAALDSMFGD